MYWLENFIIVKSFYLDTLTNLVTGLQLFLIVSEIINLYLGVPFIITCCILQNPNHLQGICYIN